MGLPFVVACDDNSVNHINQILRLQPGENVSHFNSLILVGVND